MRQKSDRDRALRPALFDRAFATKTLFSALEVEGCANSPAVDPAVAQIAGQCGVAVGREVVELKLQVRVDKPVQTAR